MKTHAEGCAESMGNIVDMHSDKRRGRMELVDAGKEAAIHWNCPPLSKADGLGTRALDKKFGVGRWNFLWDQKLLIFIQQQRRLWRTW